MRPVINAHEKTGKTIYVYNSVCVYIYIYIYIYNIYIYNAFINKTKINDLVSTLVSCYLCYVVLMIMIT